ncbi:MFS transporter [Paraburkholderia sp. Ac-20336]|uniref:MFS transporter n=1 Tax=Burkholderiaceae TaxID=119060 RepID=UPI00141E227F|nr:MULTISPECIES: MFS transporter [Burkholderiaceae]MBN3801528.1 MFS transporter [Paraburkholderia sp. Ac-20336]NIF55718.1 MFS transporter [Burkholderia sp. Ax-1724]NIF78041.1 MFS transporter [Paraburkholderia sp. Cy-641]
MTTSRFELPASSDNASSGDDPQSQKVQRLARSIFLVQLVTVGIGYLIYSMNRSAFPIGLHSIAKSLGFSVQQVGTLATIFLLGQALIDVPAGLWNAGHGKAGVTPRMNALMLIGTAGAGATSMLLAYFAYNYPLTLSYRVLFGVFEGIFNISAYSFAGSVLPQRRAFLNNCLGFFFATGAVIGPTVFSQIIATSDENTGWRLGLSIFGAVTIVLAVVMFIVMALTLKKMWRDQPAAKAASQAKQRNSETTAAAFLDVARRGSMWKGLAIHAVNLISYWEFSGLMPTFLIQYQHKSVGFVGVVFGFGFGLTSLVSPLFGWIADRYGRQVVVATLGIVDAIGLYVLLNHPAGQAMTMVVVFIIGVGLNTLYFMGYTLAQDGVPNHRVAIATGFAGAIGYLVASGAGPVSGWLTGIADYRLAGTIELIGPQIVVAILAIVFLPGIRTWQRMKKDGPLID